MRYIAADTVQTKQDAIQKKINLIMARNPYVSAKALKKSRLLDVFLFRYLGQTPTCLF